MPGIITPRRSRVTGLIEPRAGQAPFFTVEEEASPVGVTTSIEFDGSTTMYLANTTVQAWGFGDAWTWMIWWKKTGNPSVDVEWMSLDNATNNVNKIRCTNEGGNPARNTDNNCLVYMSNGSSYKRMDQNTYWTGHENAWKMWMLRWTPTSTLTKNRDLTVFSSSDSDPGSGGNMSATNRRLTASFLRGIPQRIHSVAVWSVDLDSNNYTAVYNGGDGTNFDLREDSGNYDQSANLQHWWVFGADTSTDNAMGTDWGNGSNLINIMDNAANITTADLVSDSPT